MPTLGPAGGAAAATQHSTPSFPMAPRHAGPLLLLALLGPIRSATVGLHRWGTSAPAPAPAAAAAPAGGEADDKAILKGKMELNGPEQGFMGGDVKHEYMTTWTGDWQTEYGPKAKHFE